LQYVYPRQPWERCVSTPFGTAEGAKDAEVLGGG
jgi:hypothetical protein